MDQIKEPKTAMELAVDVLVEKGRPTTDVDNLYFAGR